MEIQEKGSFRNEMVTRSVKKGLREGKLERRKDWTFGKSELAKRAHARKAPPGDTHKAP